MTYDAVTNESRRERAGGARVVICGSRHRFLPKPPAGRGQRSARPATGSLRHEYRCQLLRSGRSLIEERLPSQNRPLPQRAARDQILAPHDRPLRASSRSAIPHTLARGERTALDLLRHRPHHRQKPASRRHCSRQTLASTPATSRPACAPPTGHWSLVIGHSPFSPSC